MKLTFFLAFLLVAAIHGNSQPIMVIEPDTIDFGEVEYRSDQSRIAMIYNIGDEPLLLTNVISSCGCTVPSWTRDSIYPQDSSEIEVEYNTYILGPFKKTVTVYSNDSIRSPMRFTIMGEVVMSTGIEQISAENLVIYPNPACEFINITGLTQPAEVKIYSIQGQLMKTLYHVEDIVEVRELPAGLYILNLTCGSETIVRKIVVER